MSLAPTLPPQPSPPRFALSDLAPHALTGVEAIALPVLAGPDGVLLGPGAADAAEALGIDLLALADEQPGSSTPGAVLTVPLPLGSAEDAALRRVLLVGAGEGSVSDLRRAAAAVARSTSGLGSVATSLAALGGRDVLEAVVAGLMLASFRFDWRSEAPAGGPVDRVVLSLLPDTEGADLDRAVAIGGASWRARALAWVPSNLKNPPWLADQAVELAAEAGLAVQVLDEHDLAEGGFGGILGVGAASATPPRLIRLDYTPPTKRGRTAPPTVVLVGKGITFDSGGLSIKPADGMLTMKRDMTGGGVVLATMAALAQVGCPVRVVGLVPAAENAISGTALRPGDVLRHYGGRTSEVTNTDAEGRLVLADALAYAVAELDPAVIVDIATLTGAMKVALGQSTGGLFANDDALAATLLAAGDSAGEPLWRFPLASVYAERIASKVADADNAGGSPGAITAALFLQPFVGDVPWAHLDIASVGDAPADRDEWTKGPTGFGARALLAWLGSADPLAGIGA